MRGFAILLGGRLVGMSCYLGIEEARGVLEIGNTYYIPAMRGTGLNRRVKDLMIGRAFDCGFRRIEFRVDSRNARSQAAMAKLGAVREGVIRAERITWTGHVRDTVLFSILADEWRRAARAKIEPMAKLYFYYASMNAGQIDHPAPGRFQLSRARHGDDAVHRRGRRPRRARA